jgi:hypothetical protein
MNFDEMVAQVLPLFPDAIFDQDAIGEVVISTGFRLVDNELIPMEEI